MTDTVLVVGTKPGSLGAAVCTELTSRNYNVVTMGITPYEDIRASLVGTPMDTLRTLLASSGVRHVVCTAGVNEPREDDEDPTLWYAHHMEANVIGPMRLCEAWVDNHLLERGGPVQQVTDATSGLFLPHFVAISSNSARIPRTQSGAYCASKAALSMALRVAAREGVGGRYGYVIYGYEPGLLARTPMTTEVQDRLGTVPLTRMRGRASYGLDPATLARVIVHNLGLPGVGLNGTMVPFDEGEQ